QARPFPSYVDRDAGVGSAGGVASILTKHAGNGHFFVTPASKSLLRPGILERVRRDNGGRGQEPRRGVLSHQERAGLGRPRSREAGDPIPRETPVFARLRAEG